MACNGSHPRVGIFALVRDSEGRILIGRRLSALGKGHWGFPGGHLEQNEDFFPCVERETLEETGLAIEALEVVGMTNDIFADVNKHYVTIFVNCRQRHPEQTPATLEPTKCEGWAWKSPAEIANMAERNSGRQELFLPVENLVRQNAGVLGVDRGSAARENGA